MTSTLAASASQSAAAGIDGQAAVISADAPFRSHFYQCGPHRLHYLDEGSGPPVVMVHGNPNWVYYWRNLIPALSDRFRCLAIDHIGCGLSDKPGDDQYQYTLSQRIDDFTHWLDSLALNQPISLVAHDWGGMIACGFAVQHPHRVDKLVMLNTAAFPLPASKPVPWQLRLARTPGLGAWLVRGFNAFSRGAVTSCVTRRPMSRAVAEAYCRPYDSWAHRIAVHRFVQDIPLHPGDRAWSTVQDIATGLPQLRGKPMLLGWGDRDFVFDHHFLAEWQRRFPDALLKQYPDCGHYVLEDAAEELIPAIREFLLPAGGV
jgi:cis-3-alkyl-4-acyloxetan-2-one decarboxylase